MMPMSVAFGGLIRPPVIPRSVRNGISKRCGYLEATTDQVVEDKIFSGVGRCTKLNVKFIAYGPLTLSRQLHTDRPG